MSTWVIPYIDQEPAFWDEISARFGPQIAEVYFPAPGGTIATGRSRQPEQFLSAFLRHSTLSKSVLINPIVLHQPTAQSAPAILETLQRLRDDFGVRRVTVANPELAMAIKEALPDFSVVASILMTIATPAQVLMIRDYVDAITPDSRLLRDLHGLRDLRQAFAGELRLLVNEACIPGCPFRNQHFYEMGYGGSFPHSLCQRMLDERPWLRLTGAWILPQHLSCYEGLYDTLKLAGRVTLRDPARYLAVLHAYVTRKPMLPADIGGGPASVLEPIPITDAFFDCVLHCNKHCDACSTCSDYYEQARAAVAKWRS